MSNILAVGGHSTGRMALKPLYMTLSEQREQLEAVAHAAVDISGSPDAAIFTVYQIEKDPTDFIKAARGAIGLFGSIANKYAITELGLKAAVSFSGPEKTKQLELIKGAGVKSAHHLRSLRTGSQDKINTGRLLLSGGYRLLRHLYPTNIQLLGDSSDFSTRDNNFVLRAGGVVTGNILSELDELFSPSDHYSIEELDKIRRRNALATGQRSSYYDLVEGARHDDFLVNPEGFTAPALFRFLEAVSFDG